MLLGVLDNRDSFTYNLVHLLEPYFAEVRVRRCDDPLALADLHDVDALVLSPGPGLPRESGALMDVIADHFGRTPILGVCLGMQAWPNSPADASCTRALRGTESPDPSPGPKHGRAAWRFRIPRWSGSTTRGLSIQSV